MTPTPTPEKEHDGKCFMDKDGIIHVDPACKFHNPETRATIDPKHIATPKQDEWEKEFDEFAERWTSPLFSDMPNFEPALKSFIRHLRQEAVEEERERVRKWLGENHRILWKRYENEYTGTFANFVMDSYLASLIEAVMERHGQEIP
jgi:hypothetical protein